MLRLGANALDNDKTRILTTIIREMASGLLFAGCPKPNMGAYIQTGGWKAENYKIGDLVICNSSGLHDWTVGFVNEVRYSPQMGVELQLREIGSNRLCNMSNESFFVIKGLSEEDLWEGLKYKFGKLILKTFRKFREYERPFSHIEFIDDTYANVFVRELHGGYRGHGAERTRSVPFSMKIRWNRKKVSMKQLYQEMQDEGYLTKSFSQTPDPAPENSSMTKVTIGRDFVTTVTEGPPKKE